MSSLLKDCAHTNLGERSEEHTSELQSRLHLVCRLLLEKKKNTQMPRQQTAEPETSQTTARALLLQEHMEAAHDWHQIDKPTRLKESRIAHAHAVMTRST